MSAASGDWLSVLLAEASASPKSLPEQVEAPADLVDTLRRRLAIRGRTAPASLLPADTDVAVRQAVLSVVLPDCDPGVSNEGWLLLDDSRRAVLAEVGPGGLKNLLQDDPAKDDPTWQALDAFGEDPASAVKWLPARASAELLRLPRTLGGAFAEQVDTRGIRWELGRHQRRQRYARIADGFVGRRWEQRYLRTFLEQKLHQDPYGPVPVRAILLHGRGGSGKSALLAAVLTQMLEREPDLPLVHLDFDRLALDPLVPTSLDIEALRQLGLTSRQRDTELQQVRFAIRAAIADPGAHAGLALESVADTASLGMEYSLSWLRSEGRPLLIVLDTAEQVAAGGSARVGELLDWIGRLAAGSGAPEIRVILSGRDDPEPWLGPHTGSSARRYVLAIGQGGQSADDARTKKLPELGLADAVHLLEQLNVPPDTARRLVDTFGGNPLILRLLAELVSAGDSLEAPAGKLPPGLVQGYLYDRILKHLAPEIRRYAHPGLAMPGLNARMIAEVLGPLLGENAMSAERSRAILEGLSRPAWLIERIGDTIRLRRDLRGFTLQLMASDSTPPVDMAEVHGAAESWHLDQYGAEHEALALYHRLMRDPATQPPGPLPQGAEPYLLPLLDDLPEQARETLRALLGHTVSIESAAIHLSDIDWDQYLREEGGTAEQVSESRTPTELLDLWRQRPTGAPGEPPTAILQALADSGEWHTDEASPGLIARRLLRDAHGDPQVGPCAYWATCLALLQPPHQLPVDLVTFLTNFLYAHPSLSEWPANIARLIALSSLLGSTLRPSLLASTLPASKLPIREPRLAQAIEREADTVTLVVAVDRVIVLQGNWGEHARAWSTSRGFSWMPADAIEQAQKAVDALHGAPLSTVGPTLRGLASFHVSFTSFGHSSPAGQYPLLLRDLTPELHRPIRQALWTALGDEMRIRAALPRFRTLLSICPRELEPDLLMPRLQRDPAGWWLQLVQFADQARVLGPLLDIVRELAPDSPLVERVATVFRAWDLALGRGTPSAWNAPSAPSAPA